MLDIIKQEVSKHQTVVEQILNDADFLSRINDIVHCCMKALSAGGKILFAGNGGSAADAQHLAAELVGRFSYTRPAISAIALTTDTSALTAISNDYTFEKIFSRQIEALGKEGDVFFGISTSGRSPNILRAFQVAHRKKISTIGFTGQSAPQMSECCDILINIPSFDVPRIQECHIMVGHIVCKLIEEAIYSEYRYSRNEMEDVLVPG